MKFGNHILRALELSEPEVRAREGGTEEEEEGRAPGLLASTSN
jgi:hypothetical protein